MQLRGTYQPRTWAFPQLPWGTLMRPRVVAAGGFLKHSLHFVMIMINIKTLLY